MGSTELPVVIVGTGMAGPTLAILLQQHSIRSILYELREPRTQHGGNIALAPNAVRVLNNVGILDSLRPQRFSYEELAFMNGSGQSWADF
jgi:2-polyprenyl-6-methoxyphenol hydroxylase-like FAD-dependent oxidoreductase